MLRGRGTSPGTTDSVIVWTDEKLSVLGRAVRSDLADRTLYEWWRTEAGPWRTSASPAKDGDPPDTLQGMFEATGVRWTLTFEASGRYEESELARSTVTRRPSSRSRRRYSSTTASLRRRSAARSAPTTRSTAGGCVTIDCPSIWCRAAVGITRASTSRTPNGPGSTERDGPSEILPGCSREDARVAKRSGL